MLENFRANVLKIKICSFLGDGVTSISFEPIRMSKTLRKLVPCGVESVTVIKMSFFFQTDATFLRCVQTYFRSLQKIIIESFRLEDENEYKI